MADLVQIDTCRSLARLYARCGRDGADEMFLRIRLKRDGEPFGGGATPGAVRAKDSESSGENCVCVTQQLQRQKLVSAVLDRLQKKVAKQLRAPGMRVALCQGVEHECAWPWTGRVSDPICEGASAETATAVADVTSCAELRSGHGLAFTNEGKVSAKPAPGGDRVEIVVNPPTVWRAELPPFPAAGLPLMPVVQAEFHDGLRYRWFRDGVEVKVGSVEKNFSRDRHAGIVGSSAANKVSDPSFYRPCPATEVGARLAVEVTPYKRGTQSETKPPAGSLDASANGDLQQQQVAEDEVVLGEAVRVAVGEQFSESLTWARMSDPVQVWHPLVQSAARCDEHAGDGVPPGPDGRDVQPALRPTLATERHGARRERGRGTGPVGSEAERGTESALERVSKADPPTPQSSQSAQAGPRAADARGGAGLNPPFRVLSYNVLADYNLRQEIARRKTVDPRAQAPLPLVVERRRQQLLDEILAHGAELVCLQEVDRSSMFADYLKGQLRLAGYDGVYANKAGTSTPLGCALFWDSTRFECVAERTLDLTDLGRDGSSEPGNEAIAALLEATAAIPGGLADVMRRTTTVANIALLRDRERAGAGWSLSGPGAAGTRSSGTCSNGRRSPLGEQEAGVDARYVCVANVHLFGDPGAPHVRLLQTSMVVNACRQLCEQHVIPAETAVLGKRRKSVERAQRGNTTTIIAGDFNCGAQSGVAELLVAGRVAENHPDWAAGRNYRWETTSYAGGGEDPREQNEAAKDAKKDAPTTGAVDEHEWCPAIPLSTGDGDEFPRFTNATAESIGYSFISCNGRGMPDHVFYSQSSDHGGLRCMGALRSPAEHETEDLVRSQEPCSTEFPSDHVPVVVDFAWWDATEPSGTKLI